VLQKRSAREPNKTAKTGKKNREKPVTRPVQAVQLQCLKKKQTKGLCFSDLVVFY
jgi:hypothetical protein